MMPRDDVSRELQVETLSLSPMSLSHGARRARWAASRRIRLVYVYTYVYIYIERERERDQYMYNRLKLNDINNNNNKMCIPII